MRHTAKSDVSLSANLTLAPHEIVSRLQAGLKYVDCLMDIRNPNEMPDWMRYSAPVTPKLPSALEPLLSSSPSPPAAEKSLVLKLQESLNFGRKLLENKRATKDAVIQWLRRIKFVCVSLFGKEVAIVKSIDSHLKEAQQSGLSPEQFSRRLADAESVLDCLNALAGSPLACAVSHASRAPSTRSVFIIHGHDRENALLLDRLLREEFGLRPILMLAKPGMSRPLTDKFEEEAGTCSFAFALFTPDDSVVKQAGAYHQARPNVIYETGWFIGRLGRRRVLLLLKDGTEIHSDLHGVSQIRFTNSVEEKFREIQRELRAAGVVT